MKKLNILLICLILISLVYSCSKRSQASYNEEEMAYYEKKSGGSIDDNIEMSKSDTDNSQSDKIEPESQDKKQIDRKIIKNGDMSIKVKSMQNIEARTASLTKKYNGYIANSSMGNESLNMEIRIPSEYFDSFMNSFENQEFGKISRKKITTEDVTRHYYDLQNRIKNKQDQLDRVREFKSLAKNLEELMLYEKEITRITQELESIKTEFLVISNLVSYSTININFFLAHSNQLTRNWPSLKKGFFDFGYFVVQALYYVLIVILYALIIILVIVIFLSIIIVPIGFIYMIAFGKIGIVVKFFKFLSGADKKE